MSEVIGRVVARMGARHRGEVEPAQVKPESFIDLVEELDRADARTGTSSMQFSGQHAMTALLVFDWGDDAVCDQMPKTQAAASGASGRASAPRLQA